MASSVVETSVTSIFLINLLTWTMYQHQHVPIPLTLQIRTALCVVSGTTRISERGRSLIIIKFQNERRIPAISDFLQNANRGSPRERTTASESMPRNVRDVPRGMVDIFYLIKCFEPKWSNKYCFLRWCLCWTSNSKRRNSHLVYWADWCENLFVKSFLQGRRSRGGLQSL